MKPLIIACLCVGLLAGMALAAYLWSRPAARCPNPNCRRPLARPGAAAFCPACGASLNTERDP